jgi:hypothetical protein
MSPTTDSPRSRRPDRPDNAHGRLREDMEATALAHVAADSSHVEEAMASVSWERRGLLQRLTRGSR